MPGGQNPHWSLWDFPYSSYIQPGPLFRASITPGGRTSLHFTLRNCMEARPIVGLVPSQDGGPAFFRFLQRCSFFGARPVFVSPVIIIAGHTTKVFGPIRPHAL